MTNKEVFEFIKKKKGKEFQFTSIGYKHICVDVIYVYKVPTIVDETGFKWAIHKDNFTKFNWVEEDFAPKSTIIEPKEITPKPEFDESNYIDHILETCYWRK